MRLRHRVTRALSQGQGMQAMGKGSG
jgi:hypothetical protein